MLPYAVACSAEESGRLSLLTSERRSVGRPIRSQPLGSLLSVLEMIHEKLLAIHQSAYTSANTVASVRGFLF